ncbi:MAG: TonB-dependent receptor [Chromatiales bacterium]|nr:TonB-dependent receptor [Chromatiales bacterium]
MRKDHAILSHRRSLYLSTLILLSNSAVCASDLPLFEEKFNDLLALPIEALMNHEVTVASRYNQRLIDAPATITVIDREQIDQMGVDNLSELLARVPGIQVDFDSNTANRIPVFNVRGQYHAHVLILLDGETINDHVNPKPVIFARNLSLHHLERVEVMRGPGSSIYGNSASAAIINLVTRHDLNEVTVEVGQHGAKRAAVGLSKGSHNSNVHLFYEHLGDDGQLYSNLFDRHGLTSITEDPKRSYTLHLTGHYEGLSASLFRTHMRQEDFYLFGGLGNGDNIDLSTTSVINLGYETDINNTLKANFKLGYRHYKDKALSLSDTLGPAPDLLIGPYFSHQVFSLSSHFVWELNKRHTLSGGVSYERADSPDAYTYSNYDVRTDPPTYLGDPTVLEDPDFRFIADVTRKNHALFMQDEISGHNWKLTLGGRYDHYNDTGSRFSPKLSAIYWLDTNQQIKFHYGEAFQAPVMARMYNANNPMTLGNLELEPAVIRTFDLGFNKFTENYAANFNVYYSQADDIVLAVPTETGSQLQYRNVGNQRTAGAEVALTLPLTNEATLRLNYQHIFENDFSASQASDTPSPVDFVADSIASFDFNYKRNRWNFNLNGFLHNGIKAIPEEGSVVVVDTKVQYQFSPNFTTYIKVKNLFDEEWFSVAPANGLGMTDDGTIIRATPNRGRWIYAGFTYRF